MPEEFLLSGALTVELMEAVFAKGALFRLTVKGSSMNPFIRDGDIITISPVSRSPASLGKPAACLFPVNKKLLVHRLVARKGRHYLIKGDNTSGPDCLIDKEHIIGCVTSIERENKTTLFGLGPERLIIAFLSRNGLLPLLFSLWRSIPKSLRKIIKCAISL